MSMGNFGIPKAIGRIFPIGTTAIHTELMGRGSRMLGIDSQEGGLVVGSINELRSANRPDHQAALLRVDSKHPTATTH